MKKFQLESDKKEKRVNVIRNKLLEGMEYRFYFKNNEFVKNCLITK